MAMLRRRLPWILLGCLLAVSSALALQPQAQNVSDGVYTTQQATGGQTLYQGRCSTCHGPTLGGRTGPPLNGDDFLANWETQPLLELANKISRTMPKDDTDRLCFPIGKEIVSVQRRTGSASKR